MRWQQLHVGIAQSRREKEAREERDIEQAEIAAAVGVSTAAYSRWERGERRPSEADIEKLAAYFDVTPMYLRYGVVAAPRGTSDAHQLATAQNTTVDSGQPMAAFTANKKPAAKKASGGRGRNK